MKGALPGEEIVRCVGLQAELRAAILKTEPKPVGNVARSASLKDALDERDHVAFGVGGGQVRGVSLVETRIDAQRRVPGIDQRGARVCVLFGEQLVDRDLGR